MTITLDTPDVDRLDDAVRALREWQHDDAAMQLHPGDLGWFWRWGADAVAAAVRTWRRAGSVVAVGLVDGLRLLRLTVAPDARLDETLAQQVIADVSAPDRGVLPAGAVSLEAPDGAVVKDLLLDAGWRLGEAWTPLRRDLAEPVAHPDLRVDVVGPERAAAYTAVHRSAFDGPTFTESRWVTMTSGSPYANARCLLGYDDRGTPVAEVTVWSAGPGRPGLLEPMGVHAEQRGHGYGRAICVAAAAALSELGSSSAVVCTRSANTGGIATYLSAGFEPRAVRRDVARTAPGSTADAGSSCA